MYKCLHMLPAPACRGALRGSGALVALSTRVFGSGHPYTLRDSGAPEGTVLAGLWRRLHTESRGVHAYARVGVHIAVTHRIQVKQRKLFIAMCYTQKLATRATN